MNSKNGKRVPEEAELHRGTLLYGAGISLKDKRVCGEGVVCLFCYDSPGTYIAGFIVAFVFVDADAFDAGVDEFEFARGIVGGDYDADVTYVTTAAAAGKEDEVTFAELIESYRDSFGILYARGRGNLVSELLVDIAGEAGAVESIRAFGAPDISFAKMGMSFFEEIVEHHAGFGREAADAFVGRYIFFYCSGEACAVGCGRCFCYMMLVLLVGAGMCGGILCEGCYRGEEAECEGKGYCFKIQFLHYYK